MAQQSSQQYSPYSSMQGAGGRYGSDYMHERNIENVKDERKTRLMEQSNAEQELQRAKLYGQDQRVPVLEGNVESAKEARRRNSMRLEQSVQSQYNDPLRSYGYGYHSSELNKNLADSKTQNIKSQMDLNEKTRQHGYPSTSRPYYSSYDDHHVPSYSRSGYNPQQQRYGSAQPQASTLTHGYEDRPYHSGYYSPSRYTGYGYGGSSGYGGYGGQYGGYGGQYGGQYGSQYGGQYGGYGGAVDRMHERNLDNIKDERTVRLDQQEYAQKEQDQAERRQEAVEEYDPHLDSEVKVLEKQLEVAKENRRRNSIRLEQECKQQYNEPFRGGYSYDVNTMLAKNKSDRIKQTADVQQSLKPGNETTN